VLANLVYLLAAQHSEMWVCGIFHNHSLSSALKTGNPLTAKIGSITCHILEMVQDRIKLLLVTNMKSHIGEWPWMV